MKTKNGYEVQIHDMHGKGTYCIKGSIIIPKKQPIYNIWDKKGRLFFFKESEFDLDLTSVEVFGRI